MRNAIELSNVTKAFGPQTAVGDLSLRVPTGSVYGFIGPNGSGKTTTLRMITRILLPDRGTVRVLGEDHHGPANDRVAYLPEERGLYKQMRVGELLRFYSRLKSHSPSTAEIDGWLERMQLTGHGDKKIEQLSKGMSQKVQFIATVIARPELVLLDEPFSGLDPINATVLREMVLDLKKQGTTVIFSTHDMSIAEKMCDFIFMIFRGRKMLDGTLESIQRDYGSDTIRVEFLQPASLTQLPGVLNVTDFGKYQELRVEKDCDSQRLLAALMERGKVAHFEIAHPTLQDIFVRVAGGPKSEIRSPKSGANPNAQNPKSE
jgi:ABC-2 type transport system ATP-binding protein